MNCAKNLAIVAWAALSSLTMAVGAEGDDSLDSFIDELAREVSNDSLGKTGKLIDKIAKLKDPAAIPKLIGIIDSDNSYKSVYQVGSQTNANDPERTMRRQPSLRSTPSHRNADQYGDR